MTRIVKTTTVQGFDPWFSKDNRQQVLWPTTIEVSPSYFDSLQQHAVSLDLVANPKMVCKS